LRDRVNRFEIVAPDGQPVRWALNLLHHAGLTDRVYGPEIMLRLCASAALRKVPVYLYGGAHEAILDALVAALKARFPALIVAGAEVPPFRALTTEEDAALVARITNSGAGLLFIGLGCPKQDLFASEHRDRLSLVQCCVGAAFDFHAGAKAIAPAWMQRHGLEWLFRLSREPRRLAIRYAVTNTVFLKRLLFAWVNGAR
jgi:exopolysaccharide biosynthesis WecB/TagA/CpsF family protein